LEEGNADLAFGISRAGDFDCHVAVGCPFAGRAGVCAASDLGKRVVVSRDNPDKTTIAAIR
jgi:hypothetical protein